MAKENTVEMKFEVPRIDDPIVAETLDKALKPAVRNLVIKTVVMTSVVIFGGLALRRLVKQRVDLDLPAAGETVVVDAG